MMNNNMYVNDSVNDEFLKEMAADAWMRYLETGSREDFSEFCAWEEKRGKKDVVYNILHRDSIIDYLTAKENELFG